jgi:hypothetical protein
LIENGPDIVNSLPGDASFLWVLSAWIADPAVLTAIASLMTALAAFFRNRRRSPVELGPASDAANSDAGLSRAYQQLHDVEDRIREELLLQLQNLQEEAELIGLESRAPSGVPCPSLASSRACSSVRQRRCPQTIK